VGDIQIDPAQDGNWRCRGAEGEGEIAGADGERGACHAVAMA
jgi:hypothetical protein